MAAEAGAETLGAVVAAESGNGLGEAVARKNFFALVAAVKEKRRSGAKCCKLTDRSVFVSADGAIALSLTSVKGGETDFMSPEQLRSARKVAGADAWALGVLLWLMLDGELPDMPFGLQKEAPAFTARIPDSEQVRALLRKAMERSPAQRATIDEIEAWEWTLGGGAAAPPAPAAAAASAPPALASRGRGTGAAKASPGGRGRGRGVAATAARGAAAATVSRQPATDNPLDPHKHVAFEAMVASVLHDKWRAQRKLMADLSWEPRLKEVEGLTYDIANLEYHELPEKFQTSNLMSARDACEAVMEAVQDNRILDYQFLEEASDEQHQQWMRENASWAPPDLMVPYLDLTEEEKQKDRDIVLEAVRLYKKLVPCVAVAIQLPPAPSMELAARKEMARTRQREEEQAKVGAEAAATAATAVAAHDGGAEGAGDGAGSGATADAAAPAAAVAPPEPEPAAEWAPVSASAAAAVSAAAALQAGLPIPDFVAPAPAPAPAPTAAAFPPAPVATPARHERSRSPSSARGGISVAGEATSPTTRGHLNFAAALETQRKMLQVSAERAQRALEEKHALVLERLSTQQYNLSKSVSKLMHEKMAAQAATARWQQAAAAVTQASAGGGGLSGLLKGKAKGGAGSDVASAKNNRMLVDELQAANLSKQMLEVQLRGLRATHADADAEAALAEAAETRARTLRVECDAASTEALALRAELGESARALAAAGAEVAAERSVAERSARECSELRTALADASAQSRIAEGEGVAANERVAAAESAARESKAALEASLAALEARAAEANAERAREGEGAKALVDELSAQIVALQAKTGSLQAELAASQKATQAERAAVETLGLRATKVVNALEARMNMNVVAHAEAQRVSDATIAALRAQIAAQ